MRLSQLSYIALEMNAVVDSGKYDHITIDEVEQRIENRELIPWLRTTLGDDVDLSTIDVATAGEFHEGLLDILGGYRGQERRKWGVSKKGLCLVVAWAVEMIQHKRWQ